MNTSRLGQAVALLLLFGVCVFGVSRVQVKLDQIKVEQELVNTKAAERMTPAMAVTLGALGAFRGILADLLFLRMNAEKEKGNYFEIVQLGDLIIQLEPDMPEAICFIAWNMAYNISVTFNRHEDRWRWVQEGIRVVRDVGLVYNPDSPEVYHQIAWIYQHKVGQILDDANRYYKGQLALDTMRVLGKAQRYDWDKLAAAPNTEDDLRVKFGREMLSQALLGRPDGQFADLDPKLQALAQDVERAGRLAAGTVADLTRAGLLEPTAELLGRYGGLRDAAGRERALKTYFLGIGRLAPFYQILERRNTTYARFERDFRLLSDFPPGFREEFDAVGLTTTLDFYLRSKWLREEYKIDADFIPGIFVDTGYLDFRLPEAHAMYWARQGLVHSPTHANLLRIVANSLKANTKWGKLRYVTKDGYAVVMPNLEYTDIILQNFLRDLPKFDNNRGSVSGFENWLKDIIVLHWSWGNRKKAAEYLKFLYESPLFGHNEAYNVDVDTFALKLTAEDIGDKSDKQVNGILFGLACQCIEAMAYQEDEHAEILLRMMRRIRQRFYDDMQGEDDKRTRDRKQLPTIEEYLVSAKEFLLESEPHPELKARIEAAGRGLRRPRPRAPAVTLTKFEVRS